MRSHRKRVAAQDANEGPIYPRGLRSLSWLLPSLLAVVVYLSVLHGPMIWDDTVVLLNQMPAFDSAADVLFPPEQIPQWPRSFYRPVLTASYLLDRSLFGASSTVGPHGTGILLHLVATILATLLARQALRRFRHGILGAIGAGALFAVHPIHTETVSWITGRSDSLAMVFLLGALVFAIKYRDQPEKQRSFWRLGASGLLFFLALGAKEVAVAGLLLAPLWLLGVPRQEERETEASGPGSEGSLFRRRWQRTKVRLSALVGLYGLAVLGYWMLRLVAGSEGLFSRLGDASLTESLSRLGSAFAFYGLKLVFPPPQSILVSTLPGQMATILVVLVTGMLLAFSAKRLRAGESVWVLGLLWIVVALLPSLPVALSSLAEAPVAERYLYIPSFGLCLIFGLLIASNLDRGRTRMVVFFAGSLILLAGLGTVHRNRLWQDDRALWNDTVQKEPNSGLAWGELGKAYLDRNQELDQALEFFRRSILADNDSLGRAVSRNSIGVIHAKRGQIELAEKAWREAIDEGSNYASPFYNIVNSLAIQVAEAQQDGVAEVAMLMEAESQLKRAIELDPRYTKAMQRLVWCLVQGASFEMMSTRDEREVDRRLDRAAEVVEQLNTLDGDGQAARESRQLLEQAR